MRDPNFSTLRFLIVDDHALIRAGVMRILDECYPGCIADTSVNGMDVNEKLIHSSYDLIISDIQMKNFQTISLFKEIHIGFPNIPILVYSMMAEEKYGFSVLQAGAAGFVSKESPVQDLKNAIATVLEGNKYFSPIVNEILYNNLVQKNENPFETLSARQLEIVLLLLAGYTVTSISKRLSLEKSTTATHKGNAFRKLKVFNLLELKSLSESYSLANKEIK